jgi:hypothetical protein
MPCHTHFDLNGIFTRPAERGSHTNQRTAHDYNPLIGVSYNLLRQQMPAAIKVGTSVIAVF